MSEETSAPRSGLRTLPHPRAPAAQRPGWYHASADPETHKRLAVSAHSTYTTHCQLSERCGHTVATRRMHHAYIFLARARARRTTHRPPARTARQAACRPAPRPRSGPPSPAAAPLSPSGAPRGVLILASSSGGCSGSMRTRTRCAGVHGNDGHGEQDGQRIAD